MTADFKQKGWAWICDFYAKPEIKSACHVLQDRNRVDVTFLLYLCWLDTQKLKPKDHYLTVNGDFEGERKKIKRTRQLRRFLSTFSMTRGWSKDLLEQEIQQEKEMFMALCDVETLVARGEPVQAKQYIMYKGALPTVAWKVLKKNLGR